MPGANFAVLLSKGGSNAIASEFTDSKSLGAGTTNTYTSCNIGTAASDRLVIVCITSSGGGVRSISSVTIGGNSATIHAQSNAGNGSQGCAIASLVVPSGTTADIVVTWNVSSSNNGIMVFALTGYSNATPHDTYSAVGSSGTSISATIDTISGGIMFAAAEHFVNESMSWSTITEDADFQVNSTTMRMHGGRKTSLSTASNATETSSWATSAHSAIVAGVWL